MKNRSRIALLVVVIFLLGAVSVTAYQSASKVITLVDDGKVTQYETNANDVKELLAQLEVELNKEDQLTPDLSTEIEDNMRITIERWHPTVKFSLDGESVEFKTNFETVEQIIKAKGLADRDDVDITPDLNTAITDGLEIDVKTTQIKTNIEKREIGFETIKKETMDLQPGETKVEREGKNGVKKVTIEQTYYGGALKEEKITDVEILQKPVQKIVLVGAKRNMVKDTSTGAQYEYVNVYNMDATAYSSQAASVGTITASGLPTFEGVVAVDPNVIPLGTKLYVEGYGVAVAADTGLAIKGNKIDLYFNTMNQCYAFGRRPKTVYVLKDQSIDVKAARS